MWAGLSAWMCAYTDICMGYVCSASDNLGAGQLVPGSSDPHV